MRQVWIITLCIAAASCASTETDENRDCRGEFEFSGIQAQLQEDAFHTITQFAELDEGVEVEPPLSLDRRRLRIKGKGLQCNHFAGSFSASDMPEFQGLIYRAIQAGSQDDK